MSQLLANAGGNLIRRVGKAAKTSLAVVGVGTVAGLGYYGYDQTKFLRKESENKKPRVLVLPFDRFQIVQGGPRDSMSWLWKNVDDDDKVAVTVQDLVHVIHKATEDPQIVAIYGHFGGAEQPNSLGGAAAVEEVRNALKVFRESHRVHPEPNLNHHQQKDDDESQVKKRDQRYLYAYADTFDSQLPSNPNYYLASIFTHIHLQRQGTFRLAGFSSTVPFFKDTLEKYGAVVHVYKHGPYKNAPNSLTEHGLTKEHQQNLQSYLQGLNESQCQDIAAARSKILQAMMATKGSGNDDGSIFWKLVQYGGNLTASTALALGFVDYICDTSPLDDLIFYNGLDAEKLEKMAKSHWETQTDLESFSAQASVTFSEYQKILSKRKRLLHQMKRLWQVAEEYPMLGTVLQSLGFQKDEKIVLDNVGSKEKIALVSVKGTISDQTVRKLAPTLQKIRKDDDVKCVVVQVDSPGGSLVASEALYQHFKHLHKNVIFSFGNVAASGGYYIASAGDYIFASKSTITGSIGIYGIRFDFSGVAARYGVKFGHVATSEMALDQSHFYPVTKQMHVNASRQVDQGYQRFKEVVLSNRTFLPEKYLETIAQGRVWTGQQAHWNGLVDEIGGLNRAIAFAQRNYTTHGNAEVVTYGDEGFFSRLSKRLPSSLQLWALTALTVANEGTSSDNILPHPVLIANQLLRNFTPTKGFDIFLTTDESAAIESLLAMNMENNP